MREFHHRPGMQLPDHNRRRGRRRGSHPGQMARPVKKFLNVAVCLSGLLAASYAWPVSKALTFAVVGVLYLYLAARIVWELSRKDS